METKPITLTPLIKENHPAATLADGLVAYLAQMGVEYVFGVPGGAIEPLLDALARHARHVGGPPHLVVTRHEASAAFMADGYFRATGKLAACFATTGPGTTNLITGVAAAFANSIPMLVITPQTALPHFGKPALQDSSGHGVDTVGLLSYCTRYNSLVSHPDQLEAKLFAALLTAHRSPLGPVHLSFPLDLFKQPLGNRSLKPLPSVLMAPPEIVDQHALEKLCDMILNSRQVVLFLDEGVGEAIRSVLAFAERIHAPIVTTPAGKGWVSAYHPQFRGVFGFAGHESARLALIGEEVDCVLAVGTTLGELATGGWDKNTLLTPKLVHIDSNPENFCHSPMARLHVFGDISTIFSTLLERADEAQKRGHACPNGAPSIPVMTAPDNLCWPGGVIPEEHEQVCERGSAIQPPRLMCEVAHRFPAESFFFCDAGNTWAWATHYLHLANAGHYQIEMGFGCMTWAIGAAVGAAFSCRGRPTLCLTGDGSFLMSGQELTVAVQANLPVIFLILNNQELGMVKHGQRLGGGEAIGYQLPPVSFAGVGEAMGALGFTIRTWQDWDALDVAAICQRQGPTVIDVHIDPEATPPMGVRMRGLGRERVAIAQPQESY